MSSCDIQYWQILNLFTSVPISSDLPSRRNHYLTFALFLGPSICLMLMAYSKRSIILTRQFFMNSNGIIQRGIWRQKVFKDNGFSV